MAAARSDGLGANNGSGSGNSGPGPEDPIERRLRQSARPRAAIAAADRGARLPLSAGQQQMWFLQQLDPDGPTYLMTWALRLAGPLDAEALRRAWQEVVARHEILRTRYVLDGDEPVQVIDPPGRFDLHAVGVRDADAGAAGTEGAGTEGAGTEGAGTEGAGTEGAGPAGRADGDREEAARRLAASERRRGFDLAAEHPVRVTLITVHDTLHLLVVAIHHIACDATSYVRVAGEVSALYGQYAGGPAADLPPVATHYADFAAWEHAQRDGSLAPHLDYWRGALADVASPSLPLDRPRPRQADARCGTVDISVKPETAEQIRALAAAHRASPQTVLLAAYAAVLARLTGDDDVTVGLPVTARTLPALDDVVGYLVNTVVIRSRRTGEGTFADLLGRVRGRFLDALDHRAAPFPWVVDAVHPARGPSANPLFQAGFDVNQPDGGAFRLSGLRAEPLAADLLPGAKFDLTLHLEEVPDRTPTARLEFATAVIDHATARRWATAYEELLDTLVRRPHEPLAQVHAPALGERHRAPAADGGDTDGGADPVRESAGSRPAAETVRAPGGGPGDGGPGGGAADDGQRARLIARMHRVWCDVLGLDVIDVDANFFDVGGDSLRAVALAGRLKADGFDVSARDVFAHQSVAALADACGRTPGGGAATAGTPRFAMVDAQDRGALPPGAVDAYPLAMLQLGMIVEMRSLPEVNPYQDSTSFLIRDGGNLDAAALQRAAQLVVDRHEVLRTTFDLAAYSVPLQIVHEQARITVGFSDYGVLGEQGWQPRLEEFAARERRTLIDMACAPLIRVHAHTAEGTDEWWLSITEFHPILEGWSFHGLLMEILTCYQAFRDGRTPAAPEPVEFRYADYIAAEAAALRSDDDRAYWRNVIEGRPGIAIPAVWRSGPDAPRERYQHTVLIRDLQDDLRALATDTRTSVKAVMLAAHLKVMSMVVGSGRFVSGLVCDARPEAVGADRVPGMYLNTLPFAMPSGARTWGGLIRAVYDDLTALWPHRTFPMRAIQQEFGKGDRLLDVYYNYTDFHQVDTELIDYDRTLNDNENEFALHVFSIAGVVKLNTTTQHLSREAAQRLGALYRAVLEDMCRGAGGDAVAACLPAEETARLRAVGRGPEPAPGRPAVLESFARHVRRSPGALAVRQGGQSLTYARLDAWAEEAARQLRRSGVRAGDLVAVDSAFDLGTPAALLAVWKAGAVGTALAPGARSVPDVSAVVVSAREAAGAERYGDLPVLAIHRVRPGDEADPAAARDAAAGHGPQPQAAACVLPDGRHPGGAGAVVSHAALADAVESTRLGLEAAGAAGVPGSVWAFPSGTDAFGDLGAWLPVIAGGGTVVVPPPGPADPADPTGTADTADPAEAAGAADLAGVRAPGEAATHLLAPSLLAERSAADAAGATVIAVGDPAAGPMGACGRAVPAAGPRSVSGAAGAAPVVPAWRADPLPGWVTFFGKALPGRVVRVLDDELRPVPTGVVGELCVGGAGMPDGFHRDAALTAEHFVPDPFGSRGERLLRTGRLARFAADGTVEHLGGIERRTGPAGRPLELYRVRDLLDRQPSVRDSHVLLRPGPEPSSEPDRESGRERSPESGQESGSGPGPLRLLAYVRPAPGQRPDVTALLRHLAEELPRHLRPSALTAVDDWPLTAAGTIDLDALPELAAADGGPAGDDKPWDDEFEALLRGVLTSLPGDVELTADLPLVEVGLDSLAFVRLFVALEQTYDITVPDDLLVIDTFRTPRSLWEEVVALRAAADASGASPVGGGA